MDARDEDRRGAGVEHAARRRSALDAQIVDTRTRRRRLDEAYRADRDVAAVIAAERPPPVVENRVRRAETAFARHLAGRDAVDAGRPVEAIDALAQDDAVATRLAALRDVLATPPAPGKGRGKRR